MTKRILCGFASIFFGCLFWVAFDAERPPHELFTFDYRTVLGLIAWCSAGAAFKAGDVAFSSGERES